MLLSYREVNLIETHDFVKICKLLQFEKIIFESETIIYAK